MLTVLRYVLGLILTFWSEIDKWQKFAEIVAVAVGGAAAYFRFFRGRVYQGRLECDVAVEVATVGTVDYLKISANIKNIGASSLDIRGNLTAVRVFSVNIDASVESLISAPWEHNGTFPVFQKDRRLEAGESAHDECLVLAPRTNGGSHKIVLEVRAGRSYWSSTAIVLKTPRRRWRPLRAT